MKLIINRYNQSDKQTEADLSLIKIVSENFSCYEEDVFTCKVLELPWRDNKQRISRIPTGTYPAVKHVSPNFGKSIWIQDVPDRSEILIHVGNFIGNPNPKTGKSDSVGCPLVGEELKDNMGTGIPNLTSSRVTINKLYDLVPDSFTVDIKDNF
ncbi:MAG: DUF5675 family protein [Candidatus Paceibacterota bacterium]